MINWFKYFDQKEGKCFNTPHLYTIYTTLEYCNIGDTWYSLKILVNSLNFFFFLVLVHLSQNKPKYIFENT